ncbi:hypothetical protein [Methanobacterium paludis]|uniref:SWIM-type domain-containing protein n=1 Tax=Methanobacterium paludis (strain DSM 25820 / JCM 18151 / SWAN1) TaxID=868131 RepID=F6D2V6_METPW|nr:hypothetical protein [Methanobacterium paludis]AEG18685.1 hypothetical protein MSWAN_1674 [Methanobacterium paludis]
MATNRVESGWSLYKKGLVKLIEADVENAYYEFEVQGSKGEVYKVYYYEASWICECWDFKSHIIDPGTWHCKHCEACHFKLAEVKGMRL